MEEKIKPVVTGNIFIDLRNMHDYYGFKRGRNIDIKYLYHRVNFLKEELNEIIEAFENRDSNKFLDGLIDLIVVAVGTIDLVTSDGESAWAEVMKANNSKELAFNETRPDSGGMDLIKPLGWEAPDLNRFVGDLPYIFTSNFDIPENREAIKVLEECIKIMIGKSSDYASEHSTVKSADYYPEGIKDFIYMIDVVKRLRMLSTLDKMKVGHEGVYDSLEDTFKDRLIYTALAIEWLRGKTDGQDTDRDIFNRPRTVK